MEISNGKAINQKEVRAKVAKGEGGDSGKHPLWNSRMKDPCRESRSGSSIHDSEHATFGASSERTLDEAHGLVVPGDIGGFHTCVGNYGTKTVSLSVRRSISESRRRWGTDKVNEPTVVL